MKKKRKKKGKRERIKRKRRRKKQRGGEKKKRREKTGKARGCKTVEQETICNATNLPEETSQLRVLSPFTTPRGYLQLFFPLPPTPSSFHLSSSFLIPESSSQKQNHPLPPPLLLTLYLLPRILVYKSFFLSADLPFLPSLPIPVTLSLYYLLLFPAFVVRSCLSGSLYNNRRGGGGAIRSTIAGHKLASKTVALDPAGFTNRGRTLA